MEYIELHYSVCLEIWLKASRCAQSMYLLGPITFAIKYLLLLPYLHLFSAEYWYKSAGRHLSAINGCAPVGCPIYTKGQHISLQRQQIQTRNTYRLEMTLIHIGL